MMNGASPSAKRLAAMRTFSLPRALSAINGVSGPIPGTTIAE